LTVIVDDDEDDEVDDGGGGEDDDLFCTASCWFGYNVHQLKQTTSQETEFNITTFNG